MVASADFNDRQVDAAIEYVAVNGARSGGRVPYSRVFAAASLPPPQDLDLDRGSSLVMRFMRRFHDRCAERALPPLDCLVVQAEGARRGYPGGGYFAVNGHQDPFSDRTGPRGAVAALAFWQAEIRRCGEWAERSRPAPRHDDPAPPAPGPR